MLLIEAVARATLQTKREFTKKNVAEALGVTQNYIYQIKELTPEQIEKLEKAWSVKFDSIEGKSFTVPYWDECHKFGDLLRKDGITECCIDLQVIRNDWGCEPENLRIIAMPGEEMDGGDYPLKNKDLLVIDISRTSTIESGVFVAVSHGGSRIYVRRIIERMTSDFVYFTTVDNPKWKEYLEKKWTAENWEESDIQIIGRVIKNMSLKI